MEDELIAYTVFETLNARGLELSCTDLLKNYLFSRLRVSADLEALQHRWRGLIATVTQERFPEFLRYHLRCAQNSRRTSFKLVRDRVSTPQEVFALMVALEGRGELFSALSDPMTFDLSDQETVVENDSHIGAYRVFIAWVDDDFRNLHVHSNPSAIACTRCVIFSNDLAC